MKSLKAGGGFSCPEYVVKEAKIELPKEGFQGTAAVECMLRG